jgi:hypothetical protein
MYGIQSIASKMFFKLTPNGDKGWVNVQYGYYLDEEWAKRDIITYQLRNVEVVPIFQETSDTTTRVDRNIEFISSLRQQARKFGMTSVGVKSIDKLLDKDINHIPRILHKNNQDTYKCRVKGSWYEVLYEHIAKGKIRILGFKNTKEANPKDKIAFIEMNNHDEVLKLEIGVYGNTLAKDDDEEEIEAERKEYQITNPQCFLQGVNKFIVPTIENNIEIIERKSYSPVRTRMCYINNKWYYIQYEHKGPGRIVIYDYIKCTKTAKLNQEVVVVEKHHRKGIHKIHIIKWGTAGKDTFIIDNPHSLIH